ncbi:hypothetical protein O3P69_015079 [Scylla paramamosain]|uniref:Uncharacterized protein n=1 Tax=Scylla paramamosain TaxID=85552 RepID=A0AAW0T336_SCYPA
MTDPLAATQRWMHHPTPFSLPRTDEGVVMHALYVVVTPLLSGVDKEWRRFFRGHFDLEYASRESLLQEMEECLREVLLECGYGETHEVVACLEQGGGAPSHEEHAEGGSTRKQTSSKNLSTHGGTLLAAALNLYSVLAVHGCCCLRAPPATGKTTVWRVLAAAMNRRGGKDASRRVRVRVVACGAFTRTHLLGAWREGGRAWRKGVLFSSLSQTHHVSKNEQWVVVVGPFPRGVLSALATLCHPCPSVTDDALHHLTPPQGFKLILETAAGEDLTPLILVRALQSATLLAQCRSALTDGLRSLGLPSTSMQCVAQCACRLLEGRLTPTAPPEEVTEALTQVLDLLHTARYPHLHPPDGSYTPARLDSRSPAPSDAFLDFPGRVVAIPEFQAGLSLLPQLLDAACPLLLHSKPGHGLSTFLDIFERNLAPATHVIRFRCTPLTTSEDLFSSMIGSLLPCPLQKNQSQQASRRPLSNRWRTVDDEAQEGVRGLAPGDEGFSLLILEDAHLQLEADGASGTICETFRHLVECGEVMCPTSGQRYRLQRVVPILTLSTTAAPEDLVPARILRHCVLMQLPHIAAATCEYIIKVCLQDVLVEIDEDNYLPETTRAVIQELYEDLQEPSSSLTPSPALTQPPRLDSHSSGANEAPAPVAEEKREGTADSAGRGGCAEGSISTEGSSITVPGQSQEKATSSTEESIVGPLRVPIQGSSTEVEGLVAVPNLHHLLQLIEAVRRNSCYLQLTMGQAASLLTFEAGRVFSSVISSEAVLRKRISGVIKKYFEEVERVAWWPGVTEEGKRTMTHTREYSEALRGVQYPEGLQPIMFTQAHYEALLKLVLTLETVSGHAVVLGPPGVGKMSLARLAAYNTRARVYFLDDQREEAGRVAAIRAAVQASGVGGRRTVILLRQHALTPALLDVLHGLAHTGWSEGLWDPLRVRGLLEGIRQKSSKSPRPHENRWMTYLEEEELAALKHRLITNVRRNLHIVLIIYSRQVSEEWCRRYPPLRSRWVWVRLDDWANETLREVARRIFIPAELPPHILHQMQVALPAIHQLLKKEEALTVTVADFVEACRVTVKLLAHRRTQLRDSLALFKGGMDKLQETSGNVEELKGELAELEPELKATQEEGQRLTHALAQQRTQVSQIRDQMVSLEERVKEKCEAVSAMNEEVVQEVGEAVPGLEAAEKAIKALDKKDLVEVRVLNKPPDLVLLVMEPICILLNTKLEWAAMKTLLGDPSMMKRLVEVEKDSLSDATLRKLKKYTESPKFLPDEVGKVSKPCRPLCAWLKALEHYAQVLRNVEPKKMRLSEMERELSTIQLEQRQLQQQLGQNERELSELQARYEGCVCRRQQLEGGIKRASARLQRCTRLTTVLADEDSRWSAKIKVLMEEVENVYGECALGGVAVAYLAALPESHRNDLLQQALSILTASCIDTPKKSNLVETLSTSEIREEWTKADLYPDPACYLQAAFVTAAARRTLVFDPDYMVRRWKSLTYNLRKVLEVPPVVQTSDGERVEVTIVLVTGSASPKLPPDMCVHLTRVSFALPPLVLEERLLNDVLKIEREDLYEQRANLTASISRDQKALTAVDDNILNKLTQAATALLDNEELLAAFYEAKSTSAEFRTRLAESRRTLQKIGNVRDKYRPVATRARLLFSASTALRSLNPNYVFSLQHFLHLFSVCITSGDRTEALSFDQRIDSLVKSVTQMVVTHVSRALRPTHRLAFTTSLCAAIAAEQGTLRRATWAAILDPNCYDEAALLKAVVAQEGEFDLIASDLLRGVRLHLILHDLVTDVGLSGSRGMAEAPRGRISDFNALMLLRISKPRLKSIQHSGSLTNCVYVPLDPFIVVAATATVAAMVMVAVAVVAQLVAGAREVVNSTLSDTSLLKPDLSLVRMLGQEERKQPVLVWTDYGRDVGEEVLGVAQARGLGGITRVITAPTRTKEEAGGEMGRPPLAALLGTVVQQGGWVLVQGADSPEVLPTLLGAMTNLESPDIKVSAREEGEGHGGWGAKGQGGRDGGLRSRVHEDFRLLVSVSEDKTAPSDLTLLGRPLFAPPAPTLSATLAAVAALFSSHDYSHHYLGGAWRRAVWQVATAHTIIAVTRHWQGNPSLPLRPPSTHTPRTQVASEERSLTPSTTSGVGDEAEEKDGDEDEEEGGVGEHRSLNGHLSLAMVGQTLACLHNLSLQWPLDDPTLITFLDVVYGRRKMWRRPVLSLPREVGLVSREAALSIVTSHLTSCLPRLHNLTLDVEYRAFQEDLAAIAAHIFAAEPPAAEE